MKTIQGAMVDDEDFAKLAKFKWVIQKNGATHYAFFYKRFRNGRFTRVYMHRVVMGHIPRGLVVDHKDGYGLNNQKSNLRIVTKLENARNRHTHTEVPAALLEQYEDPKRIENLMREAGHSEEEIQEATKGM